MIGSIGNTRKLAVAYTWGALALAFVTTKMQVFPATIVIRQVMDEKGDFRVMLPVAILFGICMLPLAIGLTVHNILRTRKVEHRGLIDQSGITVRRNKSLYGVLFPMDILVDGNRVASLNIGTSRDVSLPLGTYEIAVSMAGKTARALVVSVGSGSRIRMEAGFRLNGFQQDIYLEEVGNASDALPTKTHS